MMYFILQARCVCILTATNSNITKLRYRFLSTNLHYLKNIITTIKSRGAVLVGHIVGMEGLYKNKMKY
jgi:hypothetical protein